LISGCFVQKALGPLITGQEIEWWNQFWLRFCPNNLLPLDYQSGNGMAKENGGRLRSLVNLV
jgi:hypothetical protein